MDCDKEGESIPPAISLEEFRKSISFIELVQNEVGGITAIKREAS